VDDTRDRRGADPGLRQRALRALHRRPRRFGTRGQQLDDRDDTGGVREHDVGERPPDVDPERQCHPGPRTVIRTVV